MRVRSHGEARVMRVRPHGEARVMRVRPHGEARVMRVRSHGEARVMRVRSHGEVRVMRVRSRGEARVMRVRPHGEARVMRVRPHGEARVMRVRPHGAKTMKISEVQSQQTPPIYLSHFDPSPSLGHTSSLSDPLNLLSSLSPLGTRITTWITLASIGSGSGGIRLAPWAELSWRQR